MEMSDLPTHFGFSKNKRPAIDETGPVVEVKRYNGDVAEQLNTKFSWLEIHVRSLQAARPNLLEDVLEVLLKFDPSVCAVGHIPRVENRRILREVVPKLIPIQIVEGGDEVGEKFADFWFGALGWECLRHR
jgi:hypothetical protein